MRHQVLLEGKALRVFPVLATKTPACKWKDLATANPVEIARLFAANPDAPLIGVPTGEDNDLAVIDIDPDGERWWHNHRADLPITRTHKTPRGFHLLYRYPPEGLRGSTGKLAPRVDVRAEGNFIVWWPAALCRVLVDSPCATFPRRVLDQLGAGSSPAPSSPPRVMVAGLPVSSRERDGPLVDIGPERRLPKPLYIKLCRLVPVNGNVTGHHQRRVRGALSMLLEKREGRNDALNWSAHEIFRPLVAAGVLTQAAAESLLFDAARLNGYVVKDGAAAALATIRSGLRRADPSTSGPSPSSLVDDAGAEA